MTAVRFVLARGQNAFFADLADALIDELRALGVPADRVEGALPRPEPGVVTVLLPPHEYFRLHGDFDEPSRLMIRRSIFISAEQPGTGHFDDNVKLAEHAGAVFDISPLAIRAWLHEGHQVQRLKLGWTARWDPGDHDGGRDVDVAFLGAWSRRREQVLAQLQPRLEDRRSWLLLSDNSRPNPPGSIGFLDPRERTALLGRSRVLLNVHQDKIAYAEHLRLVQAACAGAVLVTEPSVGFAPFVAGVHLLAARTEFIGPVLDAILDDEPRRRQIAADAYGQVRALPLARAAEDLAIAAARVDRAAPVPAAGPDRPWRSNRRVSLVPDVEEVLGENELPPVTPLEAALAAIKDLRLEQVAARRIQQRRDLAGHPPASVTCTSSAWSGAGHTVRVSVLIALFQQGEYVADALDSLVGGALMRRGGVEVIVVDDGSSDGSGDVVREWSAEHPTVPLKLVRHTVNQGLPHARNTALAFARANAVLVLDSDNAMVFGGLERLLEALDADPGAAFAYGILARFTSAGWEGMLSHLSWDPDRLRRGNFVDALALIRTARLRAVGGYCTDSMIYGWEDYDLWCTLAERGEYGVHVKEFVASYRETSYSMRAVMDLSEGRTRARITDRHPVLMNGGVTWPPPVTPAR